MGEAEGGGVIEFLGDVAAWFADPANWTGVDGIPNRTWEHVQMSVFAVAVAALVALPPAVVLGHKRRGGIIVVALVNLGRAVPSFGILVLFVPISIRLGLGLGFWPTFLALFFLAVPPLFTNTYTGVAGTDDALVEAGRGMGMRETQLVFGVELPSALPVVVAGARVAAVQVVATATLAALVAWGGLGRYIIDGFSTQDNVEVFAGAILVAVLAIVTELGFSYAERRMSPHQRRAATPAA